MSLLPFDDLDLNEVGTVEQFGLMLRRLHVRAGRPSFRQLEKWAQDQNAAGRREVSLTRTILSDALNGKRLPRKDFVRWFTEACLLGPEQQGIWLKTWERVADQQFVSKPRALDSVPLDEKVSDLRRNEATDPPSPAPVVRARSDTEIQRPVAKKVDPEAKSVGAVQPVFMDLLVVTVFMKGRRIQRRVSERIVTAREDGVASFTARGFVGTPSAPRFSPVKALWGCESEGVELSHPSWPATRLRFPTSLRAGESAHFASEVVVRNDDVERNWIDVHVDHHGIAPGKVGYGGRLPMSGLTIRVRFDEDCLPEAVWWYENLKEKERCVAPPERDHHVLKVSGRDLQHTFVNKAYEAGDNVGVAFIWPQLNREPSVHHESQ